MLIENLNYPEEITNSGSAENVQRIIDFLGRDKVQKIIYESHSKMNLCNNLGINVNSKFNVIKYLKDMDFDITYKNPFERKSTLIDNFTFDELQEKLNTSNH